MNFRQLRRSTGLSQVRLAKHTGVQSVTISQIELGKVRNPQYATVAKLAAGLDTTTQRVWLAIADTPLWSGPTRRSPSPRKPKSRKKAA